MAVGCHISLRHRSLKNDTHNGVPHSLAEKKGLGRVEWGKNVLKVQHRLRRAGCLGC